MSRADFNLFFKRVSVQKSCGALGNMLNIFPDGNIYLCHSLNCKEFFIGNVKTDDHKEILSKWKALLKKDYVVDLFDIDHKALCSSCKIRYLCGGFCGAQIFHGANPDCLLLKSLLYFNLLFYDSKCDNESNLKKLIDYYENKKYMDYI